MSTKVSTWRRHNTLVWRSVAVIFYIVASQWLGAVGYRLPSQDAEALARGNAFVATADNPSAIYYNPAGITQLEGRNAHAGTYVISTRVVYESESGMKARTKTDFQAVPQFYYVHSIENSPLSYGVGVYVPYGLSIDWGKDTPFRTLAQDGKLLYVTVNPVIAWQVHPTLSIGGGPTINYSKVELRQGIGFLPNDEFEFVGDDLDYGFNAGILWKPHKQWAFGINYRFETTMNYRGKSEASPYAPATGTSGELPFPQFVVAGVSFRPTENWNIEINVDWTDWDVVDSVVFEGTAGGDRVFPLNYKSSLMYEFGVTRQLANGYFIAGGYFFSENSIPDRNFTPLVPDSDLHLGSIGFGRKGERWNWAAAYHFGYNPEREVEGSRTTSLIGETADGKYDAFNQAFTLSATLKF